MRETGRSAKLGDACVREVPKLLSKDEIREFSRLDSRRYFAAVALEFALIAAAVAVSLSFPNPFVYVLAVVVIGSRINSCGGLLHEAAHWRAHKNRLVNDIVGEIVAFPTTASMTGYRNSHFTHHRELNGEKDPDWTRNVGMPEYEFPIPKRSMYGHLVRYFSGFNVFKALGGFHKNKETRDVPSIVNYGRLGAMVVIVGASVAFGFWKVLLLYWLVPLITVFVGIRYLRSVAEHYAIEETSVLTDSRTVVGSKFEMFMMAPWGLNHHLEHHLFPGIPCFRLPEVHALLMTREPFASQAHVTRGYFTGLVRECAAAKMAELRETAPAAEVADAGKTA